MRILLIAAGVSLGLLVAGLFGYQWAVHNYSQMQSAREERMRRAIALMLTVVVDIAEHKNHGETELADWKFAELRDGLEGYLRGGGPDPTQFVPRIVEVAQVPPHRDEPAESD